MKTIIFKKGISEIARSKEEHEIQVGVFEWIDYQKEVYPQLKNVFAIPNGGSRNEIEAANLRKEGVRAGVWDMFLAYLLTAEVYS